MEPELISKKELLAITGISYGQLYRWKRKQLIPESWFIRRSAFTGQETFFPKGLVLARVRRILEMKEDLSLDELAEKFAPELQGLMWHREELAARRIVSEQTLGMLHAVGAADGRVSFRMLFALYAAEKLQRHERLPPAEQHALLQLLKAEGPVREDEEKEVLWVRKAGVSVFLIVPIGGETRVESGARLAGRLRLRDCLQELTNKLA
ncbi:DUF4004 family protein [Paenibacillus xanthanilyticus]|uniref:DUF4004 family protein n=1 Tax=Paenibacillus xanthanilyticus TaxID=1783531 RepID=A0ABV8K4A8_9BACL